MNFFFIKEFVNSRCFLSFRIQKKGSICLNLQDFHNNPEERTHRTYED